MPWLNQVQLTPQSFRCGYCSREVASNQGFQVAHVSHRRAYICPNCECLSYFDREQQTPRSVSGTAIGHLPTDIAGLLKEARHCIAAGANTAAVLLARKMLMHIAVAQGASDGRTFLQYVEYLASAGWVPPNGKHWVDHIRKKGNEPNHELVVMTAVDATEILSFLEMLLIFIYDFPNRVPKPLVP